MEKETVWRLTEDDFYMVIEDHYPELTKEQREKIIEYAHHKFEIYDWVEYIQAFIDSYK